MIIQDQNILNSFVKPSRKLSFDSEKQIYYKYESQVGEEVYFKRVQLPPFHEAVINLAKASIDEVIQNAIYDMNFSARKISQHILPYKALIICYPYLCFIHDPFIQTLSQFNQQIQSYENKVKMMLSLALAVSDLHEKQYCIRVLKPGSILILSQNQNYYQIAFSQIKGLQKLSQQGLIAKKLLETNLYSAPEVLQQKDHNLSSDIWSLGIIFNEILFGTIFKHRMYSQKCEMYYPQRCPQWVKSLLEKMITLNPQNRFKIKDIVTILKKAQLCSQSGGKFYKI